MERGSDASPAAAIQEEYRLTRRKSGHNILVMAKKARRAGEVAAAEFKARCLELMDRVRETGAEYVITKHGLPVAKLVPVVEPRRDRFFGSMKGTVLEYERPLDPLDEDYEVNRG
jgi:prevent-host-death family protein